MLTTFRNSNARIKYLQLMQFSQGEKAKIMFPSFVYDSYYLSENLGV